MRNTSLNLYQNRKTGDFLIQRFANTRAVGKFISVSAGEMHERGLEITLKNLNEGQLSEAGEKPELEIFSKEEEKEFFRCHSQAYLSFGAGETIRIGPLRRKGSGYVVPRDEVIELSLPTCNEPFIDALKRTLG